MSLSVIDFFQSDSELVSPVKYSLSLVRGISDAAAPKTYLSVFSRGCFLRERDTLRPVLFQSHQFVYSFGRRCSAICQSRWWIHLRISLNPADSDLIHPSFPPSPTQTHTHTPFDVHIPLYCQPPSAVSSHFPIYTALSFLLEFTALITALLSLPTF